MISEWNDDRCIICAETKSLTVGHAIPAAVGGRLSLRCECYACNSHLGTSVEARLKRDPAVRLAIEALDDDLGQVREKLRDRQAYIALDGEVTVRAVRRADSFRVRDTPQQDGSLAKSCDAAREDVATSLRRRGANDSEIATALEQLDAAPAGELRHLGRGIAIRHGTAADFRPEYSIHDRVPDACLVAIAYRFLATCIGSGVFAPCLDAVRDGLLRGAASGCQVDAGRAERRYEPWHGLAVMVTQPLAIQVRLFGQLAWTVGFDEIGVPANFEGVSYRVDLVDGSEHLSAPRLAA